MKEEPDKYPEPHKHNYVFMDDIQWPREDDDEHDYLVNSEGD